VKAVRPEIAILEQNGITGLALPRMSDPDVIPLWFGEGDLVTPEFIRDAAKAALDEGATFYSHTRGLLSLREEIQRYLADLYGVEVSGDRISVPGATMLGITISAQMALTSGSHGLIVSPHWPNIELVFKVTGADVSMVRQRETPNGWVLTAEEIIAEIRPNTRCIFVNSPCNPTGWIMSQKDQIKLLDHCRQHDILLIADEVYHRLVYEGRAAPSFVEIAKPDDPVVIVSGFSKSWAMTGWRVGWVVAPEEQAKHWAIMSECFNTGATVFVQKAAEVALREGEPLVQDLTRRYAEGRQIVTSMLQGHPLLRVTKPEGAFYAFVKVRGMKSSWDFASGLLAEEDVGVAPGYTFGAGNEEYIRVCFAQSPDRLREGLKRLIRYTERHANELGETL